MYLLFKALKCKVILRFFSKIKLVVAILKIICVIFNNSKDVHPNRFQFIILM